MLDSVMPGRVNESVRDWLNDVVTEHGEEAVRQALIATAAAEKVTNPKGYVLKILRENGKHPPGSPPVDDWEDALLREAGVK